MKSDCGTNTLPAHRRRRACVALALLALLASCGVAAAHQLVAHAIAGGGGISHSPGGCRTLEGSIGETAAGVSANAGYTLRAGYWAGAGSAQRDSVFRTGFEGCQ
ncbi:hypothetical protein FHW12_000819 [Dokdonella fugitiva]|uniref:Lipoprotein n=1 Tax=Dokdonella fugitiva TaxID=328517 RepID=A0A839EZL0_9GAMM|nr:hypothetical protein [Dokdonella fugitiva]MBA8886628.1 hypothetical protein [Dokdonella fugitiva]